MATKGKRTFEETESVSPKRVKVEGEHDQSTSEQVTSLDNDEEFTVESDSASEQQLSDSEEDFSDDVEDDDDVGSEIIISGVQGECKKSIEGNYSLHYIPKGREIKIIIDESYLREATAASAERAKNNLIPAFKLTGLDVSKSDSEELIVYAQQLSVLAEEYPKFVGGEEQKEADVVHGGLLKLENMDEIFISTDVLDNEV